MNNFPGKFIVLYGINNLGKTTQAKMLVDKLNSLDINAEYLKYPIYSLPPSGEIINNYLRKGNIFRLSAREAQIFYAFNRTQYDHEIRKKLSSGITIVAEDYIGTSLAWGGANGVEMNFLKYINSHLIKEDIAFLFDGERYLKARESGHQFENNDNLTAKSRLFHRRLAREFKWKIINANLSRTTNHYQILSELKKIFPDFKKKIEKQTNSYQEYYNRKDHIPKPTIKIKYLHSVLRYPKNRYNAAGLDLYSADYYTLFPYEKNIIQTGIKISLPIGYTAMVIDKTELVNQGVLIINKAISPGYKDEITINMLNLSHDLLHVRPGQKIAQLLFQKTQIPRIKENDANERTDSGLF